MKTSPAIAVFACISMLVVSCGGSTEETGQPEVGENELVVVEAQDLPPEEFTTLQSFGESRDELLRQLVDEGTIPPKPIELSGERYVRDLVDRQISNAYSASGEYIDPAKVKELLHDGLDSEQPSAEPAEEQQEVTRTWRISYDVHDEATSKYKAGDVAAAAGIWTGLPTESRAFTISIEIDCDIDKLRESFQAVEQIDMPVFVLPATIRGKQCYRLCGGIFDSRGQAGEFIEQVRQALPDNYPFAMSILRK